MRVKHVCVVKGYLTQKSSGPAHHVYIDRVHQTLLLVDGILNTLEKQTGTRANKNKTHSAVRLRPEDLGSHVAGGPALRRHEAAHDAAGEAEVGELDVGVVVLGGEKQVLGLEVTVDDAEVVAVPHGVQQDAAEVAGPLLVVERLGGGAMSDGGWER